MSCRKGEQAEAETRQDRVGMRAQGARRESPAAHRKGLRLSIW
ncbi:MAG: hypothetical protein ACHQ7N_20370 [Candidatus Methylomirabilales bacterium]